MARAEPTRQAGNCRNDATETINVTRELVKRGYSEADIAKIWSGNLLRVLDRVQQVAKGIQARTIQQ